MTPPGGDAAQLLIVDLATGGAVAMSATSRFDHRPVLAATRRALYRQAGGYIMRGTIAAGRLREAVAADARQGQTALGPAGASQVAGFYRVFDAFHLFTLTDDGRRGALTLPPAPADSRLTQVAFLRSDAGPALLLTYRRQGRSTQVAALYDVQDGLSASFPVTLPEPDAAVRRGAALFLTGSDGLTRCDAAGSAHFADVAADIAGAALYAHPDGLLAAQGGRLLLISPANDQP